jgi:5-methylcytosine-specific restriction endonuclease McrA
MSAAGWVIALLAVPAVAVGSALSTPLGLAPLLVPRRSRWWLRQWRQRSKQRSARISKHLRHMVERADRRRCVYCGARRGQLDGRGRPVVLQVDHLVPWIMGGLTCLWNCALLCRRCNMVKSAYWVSPQGRTYYRRGYIAPAEAALILAAEHRARRSPARWLRAYGLSPW